MKKYIISLLILIILAVVIFSVIYFLQDRCVGTYANSDGTFGTVCKTDKSKELLPNNIEPQSLVVSFTSKDTYYGCYWGDLNQKKVGTPADWVLVYPGTKSAQWCNPQKAENILGSDSDQQGVKIRAEMSQIGCPDEMIVNKMPGVADNKSSNLINSYYIKNGKRVEISEYDPIWVNANCEIPVQEVQ